MINPEPSPSDSTCLWTFQRLSEMTVFYAGAIREVDNLGMVIADVVIYSLMALVDLTAYRGNLN
jgi:hypothetical protein